MKPIRIADAFSSKRLFASEFIGSSWDTWRAVLKATFAEPLSTVELTTFHDVAGDRPPPSRRVSEAVFAVGRSGGKDSVAAMILAYVAMTFDPKAARLRGGEFAYVLCLAVDRDQAAIVFRYVAAHFENIPVLRAMVKDIGRDRIELKNRVIIEIRTNSISLRFRRMRLLAQRRQRQPRRRIVRRCSTRPGPRAEFHVGDDLDRAQALRLAL